MAGPGDYSDRDPNWQPTEVDPGHDSYGDYYVNTSGQKVYTNLADGSASNTYITAPRDDTAGKAMYRELGSAGTASHDAFNAPDAANRLFAAQFGANAADDRAAPTTNYADANTSRDLASGARTSQADAIGMYRNAALGNAPSVAQANFAQALDASRAQNASMAASARGSGLARAAAQSQAMDRNAAMGQGSAGALAALRAQEIESARAGYAGVSSNMRGQDIGQQGVDVGKSQFVTNVALQGRAQNDARNESFRKQQESVYNQQMQGAMAREGAKDSAITIDQNQQRINNGSEAQKDDRQDKWIGAGAQAVGTGVAMLSDKTAKTDIESGARGVDSFLDAIKSAEYSYRNPNQPGAAPGRHTSVMAQDLEKSELGRRMVKETPAGKAVDYGEGFATMLAGQARLNDRLNGLERALASRTKGGK